jgi:hypothetical protein
LVKESISEKILGVTMNNKLKWDEQLINIVNTLRYKVVGGPGDAMQTRGI